jgi:hypothetical protein
LRNFGNVLGNCIYDKDYVAKVTKVKATPVRAPTSYNLPHTEYRNREDGTLKISTVTLTSRPLLRNSRLHLSVNRRRMIYPFLVLYIKQEAIILGIMLLSRAMESLAVCVRKHNIKRWLMVSR